MAEDDARWHVLSIEQVDRALHGGAAVAVLLWPTERDDADRLSILGLPRILLVPEDAEPAECNDPLEDWIRLPAADADIKVRLRRLRAAADRQPPRPLLDDAGRLVFRGEWVGLAELDERVLRPLVRSFGQIVGDDVLMTAAWPGTSVSESTLRPRMSRVRRRVAAVGLDLLKVRGRGYVLQAAQANALHHDDDVLVGVASGSPAIA